MQRRPPLISPSLLAAHRDSNGLGFAALGTPTNNTEAAPAGYSASEQRAAPLTPSESAQLPKEKDALQLLTWALGIAPDSLPADNIEQCASHRAAHRAAHDESCSGAARSATTSWRCGIRTVDDEVDRLLKTPTLYALRRYAVSYLRPDGALPLLRDQQAALRHSAAGRQDASLELGDPAIETGIGKVLGVLRPMWELASRKGAAR